MTCDGQTGASTKERAESKSLPIAPPPYHQEPTRVNFPPRPDAPAAPRTKREYVVRELRQGDNCKRLADMAKREGGE